MPGTTSGLGLRYALLTDQAHAQSGFKNLAEDVESWLAPLFAYKDSDETVGSSTTFQDDNHLTLSLPANRRYVLDAFIQYFAQDNDTVPDLKFRFNLSSSTMRIAFGRMNATRLSTGVDSTPVDFTSTGFVVGTPTPSMVAGAMGLAATLLIRGVVTTVAPGTLTFQWAQNISDASPTVVQSGSYIHLRRVG